MKTDTGFDLSRSLAWLHEGNPLVHVLVLVLAMALFAKLGRMTARRWAGSNAEDHMRGHLIAVQGSLLGLLALILGFTLNMGFQRYEARRQLVVADASCLQSMMLRTRLLPDPQRREFMVLLHDYVALRVAPPPPVGANLGAEIKSRIVRSRALHGRMLGILVELRAAAPDPLLNAAVENLIQCEVIMDQRLMAFQARIPDAIFLLLLGAAQLAAWLVGYSGALKGNRGIVQTILLTVTFSATIYVILALDRPVHGALSNDQSPLRAVHSQLQAEVTGGS